MKIALVHDYLNQQGGAERVVAVLHELYPDAQIHTLFVDPDSLWPALRNADITPSVLQRFPFVMRHFKVFFWLYPFIIMNKTVRDCDLIISSSSAYAKGIRIVGQGSRGQKPVHVCYCHTPMRFAWDYDRYIRNETENKWLTLAARLLVPLLKRWDIHTSRSVDFFIANSSVVQARIRNIYRRESVVIHPPVEMKQWSGETTPERGDYFLIVSRLVAYKRLELAVKACSERGLPLVVIGRGPDKGRLQAMAGSSVQFLDFQPEQAVLRYMAGCKALLFPGEEDFGITVLEANSLGRPVIAFAGGGAVDTIVDGVNGLFFSEPTVVSLQTALERVDTVTWDANQIRAAAERFNRAVFEQRFTEFIAGIVGQQQDDVMPHYPVPASGGIPI